MFKKNRVLAGGFLNNGRVTRSGATVVRRQDHAWPKAVSEALAVLGSRGFKGCPQELQRIDQSTVVLNFMPGRALSNPVPKWASTTRTLTRVTHFMKSFSLAGSDIGPELENADWLTTLIRDDGVFFHGDPHPTNIVFDALRRPTAIIDFELATLGSHEFNLMSLIFNWAPLEPQKVTCWRNIRDLPVQDRVAIMLTHWQPNTTSGDLVDLGREFIAWRQKWITSLARLGNPGARRFVTDPGFADRYSYAEALLRQVF